MSGYDGTALPEDAAVLRLGRIDRNERLHLCEAMFFPGGRKAIDTVLRRANVSGRVEIGGEIVNHLADVLDAAGDMVESIALDSRSYRALKNRWMRCRIDRTLEEA